MRVKAFFPCEKTIQRQNGSHDILGYGMQHIRLKKKEGSNIAEAPINFLADIQFEPGEEGEQTVQISFIGPDGETLSKSPNMTLDIPSKGSRIKTGGDFLIKTRKSGDHSLKLIISNSVQAEWPLKITIINNN